MKAKNKISSFLPLRTMLFENDAACTASCTSHVGAQTPYSAKPSVASIILTIAYNQFHKQNIFKLSPLR